MTDLLYSYVLPTQPYAPNGRGDTAKFTVPAVKDFTEQIPYGLQVNVEVCSRCQCVWCMSLLTDDNSST